jgi:TPR repeat protein
MSFNSFADELSNAATAYQRGDYNTAFNLCEKLAEQGLAKAQYNLGLMYKSGEGTPQDYAAAIKWFTKSAAQGNDGAQTKLDKLNAPPAAESDDE